MTERQERVVEMCGGRWGSHPKFPVEDWQAQVANNDTRLGYWDWVFDSMEA